MRQRSWSRLLHFLLSKSLLSCPKGTKEKIALIPIEKVITWKRRTLAWRVRDALTESIM